MIHFSHPENFVKCLQETYDYLINDLSLIIGYPVKIQHLAGNGISPYTFTTKDEDGKTIYCLPGPRKESIVSYLSVSSDAMTDKLVRLSMSNFNNLCGHIVDECKRSWDIKALLIKENLFIWDKFILSLNYSGNQKYNAIDILCAVRESLSFKYEGKPQPIGILLSLNWHYIEPLLERLQCHAIKIHSQFEIHSLLKTNKWIYKISDGRNSVLIVSQKGFIRSILIFPEKIDIEEDSNWKNVPIKYKHLQNIIIGRDILFSTTEEGELYLFTKTFILKWFLNRWHRISGKPLFSYLISHLENNTAKVLANIIVEMSTKRKGCSIIISNNPTKILDQSSEGIASKLDFKIFGNIINTNPFTIMQLASIDGCMIIDNHGNIINAGVILNIPEKFTNIGEGARTAATCYGSTFGIAIKVSTDGQILIFENGQMIRQIS